MGININSLPNKTYYNDLEQTLIASISLSILCFFSAVTVYNDMDKFKNKNSSRFIILTLVFLSLAFAIVGFIKFTTEFFENLDKAYRYTFNYFQSIFYAFLVFLLIILELIFARNIYMNIFN